jgi:sugar lactone lactonase YvrE
MQIETIAAPLMMLGECPIWCDAEGALYWIDIPGSALHRLVLETDKHDRWSMPETPGSIGLFANGDLLVALRSGLHRFNTGSGKLSRLGNAPYDPATTRYNDGRTDRLGRFWVGSIFEPTTAPLAKLYRYSAGGSPTVPHEGDLKIANGLAFSPDDRTLYLCDTPSRRIWQFDFDVTAGAISNQRIFVETSTDVGRPDGAAVDAEGCYWSALIGCIGRFTPAGKLDRLIAVPAGRVTMCAFGGKDLDTLFITTAGNTHRPQDVPPAPLAGRVLAIRPGVMGLPEPFVAEELSG